MRAGRIAVLAAVLLASAGCATPLVYSHVSPERVDGALPCTARELRRHAYLVTEERGGERLRARKDRPIPVAGLAGAVLNAMSEEPEQVIVAELSVGPGGSAVLTLEHNSLNPTPAALNDAREVLAACAPAALLAPVGLRCSADGRPLEAGEELRLFTAAGVISGRALALAGDTLVVAQAAGPRAVPLSQVRTLQRQVAGQRRDAQRKRAIIGGLLGAAVGVGIAAIVVASGPADVDEAVSRLGTAGAFMAAGPLAGAGLGWLSASGPGPLWKWKDVPLESCR